MNTLFDALFTEDNIDNFKATFKTKQGKQTLDVILTIGGYFNSDILDLRDVGKRNFCTDMLKFMGVVELERTSEYVEATTDAITSLPTKIKDDGGNTDE